MIEVDRIEAEVRKQVTALGEQLRGKGAPNRVWTAQLKQNLEQGAAALGLQARATDCKHPEWLYDMTWLSCNEQDHVCAVALVLESEWIRDGGAIDFDFNKLLQARAGLRVMVFEGHTPNATNEIIDRLKLRITNFEQRQIGNRYLFASWESGKAFRFEPYRVNTATEAL